MTDVVGLTSDYECISACAGDLWYLFVLSAAKVGSKIEFVPTGCNCIGDLAASISIFDQVTVRDFFLAIPTVVAFAIYFMNCGINEPVYSVLKQFTEVRGFEPQCTTVRPSMDHVVNGLHIQTEQITVLLSFKATEHYSFLHFLQTCYSI